MLQEKKDNVIFYKSGKLGDIENFDNFNAKLHQSLRRSIIESWLLWNGNKLARFCLLLRDAKKWTAYFQDPSGLSRAHCVDDDTALIKKRLSRASYP